MKNSWWLGATVFLLGVSMAHGSHASPLVTDSHQTESQLVKKYGKGILDFDRPDSNGQACIDCHSPLGTELAAFDFRRSDFIRRAGLHFNHKIAVKIDRFLEFRRKQIGGPWFSTQVAPLQPGGSVLLGSTPIDRDVAFMNELKARCPQLFNKPITSVKQASLVANSLLQIHLSSLKVGIPFNLLSQDVFHGASHATIADWIPDVPVSTSGEFRQLIIQYQLNPSEANLKAIEQEEEAQMPKTPLESIGLFKYRSLLRLSAKLLQYGRKGNDLHFYRDSGKSNSFWELGNECRIAQEADANSVVIPQSIMKKKDEDLSVSQQIKSMTLPWFWLGWCVDPSLLHSGLESATRDGDYFCKSLWLDGPYPSHMLFAMQRRMLERWANPSNWRKSCASHYEIQYSFFLLQGDLLPVVNQYGRNSLELTRYAENCFRMSLYLSEADLNRSHVALRPFSQINQVRLMKQCFVRWKAPSSDIRLCDLVEKLLEHAHPIYR